MATKTTPADSSADRQLPLFPLETAPEAKPTTTLAPAAKRCRRKPLAAGAPATSMVPEKVEGAAGTPSDHAGKEQSTKGKSTGRVHAHRDRNEADGLKRTEFNLPVQQRDVLTGMAQDSGLSRDAFLAFLLGRVLTKKSAASLVRAARRVKERGLARQRAARREGAQL